MASTLSLSLPRSYDAAIVVPSQVEPLTISFKQLDIDIRHFQKKLAELGIGKGDVVSIALTNSYEFVVCFLATTFQRAIAAPLNPVYTQIEFEFYISDLSSALLVVPEGTFKTDVPSVKAARAYGTPVAECSFDGYGVVLSMKHSGSKPKKPPGQLLVAHSDDIALVLHTSGTTGRPKAVPLTHHNLTRSMRNVRSTYELTFQDRTMLVMPLFHIHGLVAGLLAPLSSGGSVIIPPRFSAATFWSDFINHGANWYTAVPTIHQILLKGPAPKPLPNIRFIRSCSSALSPATFHQLEENFCAPVLEAYAMTEAAHQMCSNSLPHRGKRKPGSVGKAQGVEIALLDGNGNKLPPGQQGEISIRGENVTKGYLKSSAANTEAFTKSGFFRTGDEGKMDHDGYVYITGRVKEIINRGGEKISPVELDHVIASSPDIAEAVSFGIPSGMLGQEVGAAVVPAKDKAVTEASVQKFVAARLAKHKVPARVWILDFIPKTATGKVQRRNLGEILLKRDIPKAKF